MFLNMHYIYHCNTTSSFIISSSSSSCSSSSSSSSSCCCCCMCLMTDKFEAVDSDVLAALEAMT